MFSLVQTCTLERLGTTDRAIIHARRALLKAVKVVQEGGDPPGVAPTYYNLRAYETVVPLGVHWFDALQEKLFQRGPGRRAISIETRV